MSVSNDRLTRWVLVLQEYQALCEKGEAPDEDSFVARNSDFAGELRQFFREGRPIGRAYELVQRELEPEPPRTANGKNGKNGYYHKRSAVHPHLFEGYLTRREISNGGQSVVYLAEQLDTHRVVALKVVHHSPSSIATSQQRFEQEVELASRLVHPNIVRVYDAGESNGIQYFAMEYVDGVPIDFYVEKNKLSIRQTVELFLQVCDAIAHAHANRVIHRDLKPPNVLVDPKGEPHVLDFGLARPIFGPDEIPPPGITVVGEFAGTWNYALPEQVSLDPSKIDTRTDVYSLGVLLYVLLTKNYPYPTLDQSVAVLTRHIQETLPTPMRSYRRDIPKDLEAVVLNALEKDPAKRYAGVAALADDLRRYLNGDAVVVHGTGHFYVWRKFFRRYRWFVRSAAAVFALVLAFGSIISVLYLRLDAEYLRSTVRSEFEREALRRDVEEFDEWHRLQYAMAALRENPKSKSVVERVHLPVLVDGAEEVTQFSEEIQKDIHAAILEFEDPSGSEPAIWLREHDEVLDSLADKLQHYRLSVEVEVKPGRLLATHWPASTLVLENVSEAYSARAYLKFLQGDKVGVISDLTAARAIAVDLAGGRIAFQKSASIASSEGTYLVVRSLLKEIDRQDPLLPSILSWMDEDPCAASFEAGFLTERERLAQLITQSVSVSIWTKKAVIDPVLLNKNTLELNVIPEELIHACKVTTPQEAIEEIDEFMGASTCWDTLTDEEISEQAFACLTRIRASKARPILRPLLPWLENGTYFRNRVRTLRQALRIGCRVMAFELRENYWPEDLAEISESEPALSLINPATGREFQYTGNEDGFIITSGAERDNNKVILGIGRD